MRPLLSGAAAESTCWTRSSAGKVKRSTGCTWTFPPVFHETEDSKVDMITVFVSDSQEVGHRKIVLLPGPDVPQI